VKGLSFSALRVGRRYRLTNYGEVHDFVVERALPGGDFWVKDLHTLERYRLKDTVRFGTGKDFEIREWAE
jgi:hypothetical protein